MTKVLPFKGIMANFLILSLLIIPLLIQTNTAFAYGGGGLGVILGSGGSGGAFLPEEVLRRIANTPVNQLMDGGTPELSTETSNASEAIQSLVNQNRLTQNKDLARAAIRQLLKALIQHTINIITNRLQFLLTQQLELLSPGVNSYNLPVGFRFTKDHGLATKGHQDVGGDINFIQKFLNANPETIINNSGIGSPGNEGNLFTQGVFEAVKRFQAKYPNEILVPANEPAPTGFWGIFTRTQANKLLDALESSN